MSSAEAPAFGWAGPLDCVEFEDLEFVHWPVLAHSSRGTPFTHWVPFGMPRLPPKVLDCACYLYRDEEAAHAGRKFGGTAFLVAVPSSFDGLSYVYAVSCWHNVRKHRNSVLRINTNDGGVDVFPFTPSHWMYDPKFDVAVTYVAVDSEKHRFSTIPTTVFVLQDDIQRLKLGPGEDVFMIGRFVTHDGGPINQPAVRFGNISVMPSPIEQPNKKVADSYCIDLHSRAGYSGSPVFVYRTPGYDLEARLATDVADSHVLFAGANYLGLLGIHFAQFEEMWDVAKGTVKPSRESSGIPIIQVGHQIKGLSGMTCVLPAWHILEVLNSPRLKEQRDRVEIELAKSRARDGSPPIPEVQSD